MENLVLGPWVREGSRGEGHTQCQPQAPHCSSGEPRECPLIGGKAFPIPMGREMYLKYQNAEEDGTQ